MCFYKSLYLAISKSATFKMAGGPCRYLKLETGNSCEWKGCNPRECLSYNFTKILEHSSILSLRYSVKNFSSCLTQKTLKRTTIPVSDSKN